MSLKSLADKVLQRDTSGTSHRVNYHILSHGQGTEKETVGQDTEITLFPVQDFIEAMEERAAIMAHDAGDVYPDRQAAEAAAYEDTKIIWLETWRKQA